MAAITGLRRIAATAVLVALTACGGGGGGGTATQPPVADPADPVDKAALDEASRLTAQATFGLPFEAIELVARDGGETWLARQFAMPPGLHRPIVDEILARREAGDFSEFENDIEYLVFARRLALWHRILTGEDQLRQRVAFALSEIFVVSDNVDILTIYPYALSGYYDMLLTQSFGNFRELLEAVAYHPAMGIYLSHLNNRRADPAANTFPDENFAREVMQLFSIGLFELNLDGTPVRDARGRPLPAYDNDDIRELAKVFTGLSFGGPGAFFGKQEPYFRAPMRMFDEAHEPGGKTLFGATSIPAGQGGDADISMALDALFNHPNVGPFIGRQLIQRLVTSNPSPAYVERVARAFNGENGTARGDMRAVLRAVLLDPEARAAPRTGAPFGKLREPVVRYAAMLRQFGVTSDDGFIANLGYLLQGTSRQHPLSAPSVFNFFLPTHAPPGEISDLGLEAPEFQITDANAIVGFANLVDIVLFTDFVTEAPPPFSPGRLNLVPYLALADDPAALVDRLDTVLTYGTLDAGTRGVIENVIADIDDNPDFRVRTAIYLFLTSAAYAVKH